MSEPPRRRLRILRFRDGTTVDAATRKERLREVAADPLLGPGARVFIVDPDAPSYPPAWRDFVARVSAEELPEMSSPLNGAIVFVERGGRLWALTFGSGHLFLNEDRAEPRFGLKTVLNLGDPEQIRSVGSRVYEDVVVRTLRQVSRRSSRDAFTIDDTRDILRDVTAAPRDRSAWGTEITGGTPCQSRSPQSLSSSSTCSIMWQPSTLARPPRRSSASSTSSSRSLQIRCLSAEHRVEQIGMQAGNRRRVDSMQVPLWTAITL